MLRFAQNCARAGALSAQRGSAAGAGAGAGLWQRAAALLGGVRTKFTVDIDQRTSAEYVRRPARVEETVFTRARATLPPPSGGGNSTARRRWRS